MPPCPEGRASGSCVVRPSHPQASSTEATARSPSAASSARAGGTGRSRGGTAERITSERFNNQLGAAEKLVVQSRAGCVGGTTPTLTGRRAEAKRAMEPKGSARSIVAVVMLIGACQGSLTGGAASDAGADIVVIDTPIDAPLPLPSVPIVQIAAGIGHTCVLRRTGQVLCWGFNQDGQLGDGTTNSRVGPLPVADLDDAVEIAAAGNFSCARRRNGTVWCWGSNEHSQLGIGYWIERRRLRPGQVQDIDDAITFSINSAGLCILRRSGEIRSWGSGWTFLVDAGHIPHRTVHLENIVQLAGGGDFIWALNRDGTVREWGSPYMPPYDGVPTVMPELSNIVAITSQCVIQRGGQALCWGDNTGSLTPVPVVGLTDVVQIARGGGHACALRVHGNVVCWGANNVGQLGDDTPIDLDRNSRLQRWTVGPVVEINNATAIAAGGAHTCALLRTGVVCWGRNVSGQLGDGTRMSRSRPVAVVGL